MENSSSQGILETALRLFAQKGYENTSLADIAAEAGLEKEAFEANYADKSAIVLLLYAHQAARLMQHVQALPSGTMAARFHTALRAYLTDLETYRSAMEALFSLALHPRSEVSMLGGLAAESRGEMMRAFHQIVSRSSDSLKRAEDVEYIGTLLYGAHLLLLLYWFYDRSPEAESTQSLLNLLQEAISLLRPALLLPWVARGLGKGAGLVMGLFRPN